MDYFKQMLDEALDLILESKDFHVRWLIRRDLPEVLEAAAMTGQNIDEMDLIKLLQQRNYIGQVAETSTGFPEDYYTGELEYPDAHRGESGYGWKQINPKYEEYRQPDEMVVGAMVYGLKKKYFDLAYLFPGEAGIAVKSLLNKMKNKVSSPRRSAVIYTGSLDDTFILKLLQREDFVPLNSLVDVDTGDDIIMVWPSSGTAMPAINAFLAEYGGDVVDDDPPKFVPPSSSYEPPKPWSPDDEPDEGGEDYV